MHEFKLFISYSNPKSSSIIKRFDSFLKSMFNGQYSLEVVDVMDNPHLAVMSGVVSTPTLLRVKPLPSRYISGDISGHENTYKVLLKVN